MQFTHCFKNFPLQTSQFAAGNYIKWRYTPMKNSTKGISPNGKSEEIRNEDIQNANEGISDSLDTIAFYLFEAIKRKSNQQLQRKGA